MSPFISLNNKVDLNHYLNYFENLDTKDEVIPFRRVESVYVPKSGGLRLGITIDDTLRPFSNEYAEEQFLTKIDFRPAKFIYSVRRVAQATGQPIARDLVTRYIETYKKDHPRTKMLFRQIRPEGKNHYEIRGTLSQRYLIIDNTEVLKETIGALREDHQVVSMFADPDRTYFNVVLNNRTIEPLSGDKVILGFQVSNSEVGSGSLWCNGFAYRMVCENGLVVPLQKLTGFRQRHLGKNKRGIMQTFRTALKDVIYQMDEYGRKLEESTSIKLVDPVREMESIAKRNSFSNKVMAVVQEAYDEEYLGETLYHISNALTRAARVGYDDERVSYLIRNRLLEVGGGIIMEEPMTKWERV